MQIRRHTYRGTEGFSIRGRDSFGRQVRVFTETRTSAEAIRTKLANGDEPTLADFYIV